MLIINNHIFFRANVKSPLIKLNQQIVSPKANDSIQLITSPLTDEALTASNRKRDLTSTAAESGPDSTMKRLKSATTFGELPVGSKKSSPLVCGVSTSSFENLTKKCLETNYSKFNAFFSKFKNKKLIAKLFLTPMPIKHGNCQEAFSAADFKKTRRLLKTYMNRKTKQKIARIRQRKRRQQMIKEKNARKRQSGLKRKLAAVKLLQFFIENSNSSKLNG